MSGQCITKAKARHFRRYPQGYIVSVMNGTYIINNYANLLHGIIKYWEKIIIVLQNRILHKVAHTPEVEGAAPTPVLLAPFLPFQGIFFKEKK